MKKVTELEHFAKKNGTGSLCAIAYRIDNNLESCNGLSCNECKFFNNDDEVLKTLLRHHVEKPKLTEDEKVILRNVDKKFRWIVRDYDEELVVFDEKPYKTSDHEWFSNEYASLEALNHLFKFIEREDNEPYLIEDLLKED